MRSDRLFWIVMGILGVGVIILVLNDSAGQIGGVENYDFARFVQLGALALVFGAAVFARGRPAHSVFRQIAIWLVIFLATMVAYQFASQAGWIPGETPRIPPAAPGTETSA